MKTLKNFKGLLSITIAMLLSIGSAYSQLNIVWNDGEVPPRARDAFANNSEHTDVSTYPQPCGTSGTECAMNVGVIVWLSAEGGNLTNIIWSFNGTPTTIHDYRIKSERDYGEGFVTECSTIPLSTSVLLNQHLISYYYGYFNGNINR